MQQWNATIYELGWFAACVIAVLIYEWVQRGRHAQGDARRDRQERQHGEDHQSQDAQQQSDHPRIVARKCKQNVTPRNCRPVRGFQRHESAESAA